MAAANARRVYRIIYYYNLSYGYYSVVVFIKIINFDTVKLLFLKSVWINYIFFISEK